MNTPLRLQGIPAYIYRVLKEDKSVMKEDKISQAGEPADAFKGQQFEVVTQALSGAFALAIMAQKCTRMSQN